MTCNIKFTRKFHCPPKHYFSNYKWIKKGNNWKDIPIQDPVRGRARNDCLESGNPCRLPGAALSNKAPRRPGNRASKRALKGGDAFGAPNCRTILLLSCSGVRIKHSCLIYSSLIIHSGATQVVKADL